MGSLVYASPLRFLGKENKLHRTRYTYPMPGEILIQVLRLGFAGSKGPSEQRSQSGVNHACGTCEGSNVKRFPRELQGREYRTGADLPVKAGKVG